jgi:hypothetical protein
MAPTPPEVRGEENVAILMTLPLGDPQLTGLQIDVREAGQEFAQHYVRALVRAGSPSKRYPQAKACSRLTSAT